MHVHSDGPECPGCDLKLKDAHSYLQDWFKRLKAKYVNVHVACAYRDQLSQEQAFKSGATKLHFPLSAHNKVPALALDVFLIGEDGVAAWPPQWFIQVNQENIANKEPLQWGGMWHELGDNDHFQYKSTQI